MKSPACLARRVTRNYGSTVALAGVSAWVPSDRLTVIVGRSGSGKSTLLHCLAGLDRPSSGSVRCAGVELASLDGAALGAFRAEHTGFVFQRYNLIGTLSARENVTLPLRSRGIKPDAVLVKRLLRDLDIAGMTDRCPAEMSGGQQQRVAIARALVHRPDIVFADEPTGNLDSASAEAVVALLREVRDAYGTTIVIVTHDLAVAAGADLTLQLHDGVITSIT